MRKALAVALSLGLLAGAFAMPAEAAKKKKKKKPVKVERVVEVAYSAPGLGVSGPDGTASGGLCPFADPTTQECIEIPVELGEKYVSVELTDTTGQMVAGYISQGDQDGDGIGDLYGEFCGAHEEPVEMLAVAPLRVSFYNGACADGTPSIVTAGTIKVTFSNMP